MSYHECKQMEWSQDEAAGLLEALLGNGLDWIYFKDRESRYVHCSKAFAAFAGFPDSEGFRGKTDLDLFGEERARPAVEDDQHILRTGMSIVGKLEKFVCGNDRIVWTLTTKMPWRNREGAIIGTLGISKDVTIMKESDGRLAYERQLFRALVDSVPDSIYFKDTQSRFVRMGKTKIESARQSLIKKYRAAHPSDGALPPYLVDPEKCAEYVRGKTDFDLYPEDRARVAFEEERDIMLTGNPIIGRIEKRSGADGKSSWYHITKMPWRDEEGRIIGTFGVTRDITALKEAESQLEQAHQRLIETSRLAGMAEVATDVLHNVGNVLNSVNVSCSLALDRVKTSKAASLTKISLLLAENRERLAEFLTADPRGRQIPDYLATLAEHLGDEQRSLQQELKQLLEYIDHIKEIVAMQQSYAKVAGVLEAISPAQLVQDALHINAAALTRHDVQVQTDFAETPPVLTERHRVLQILVNLIRNAKYALDDAKRADKLMTLKVTNLTDGRVQIQVVDNGVGIPAENLTRIFSHGFTTRRNGHGFGLHSSALAVKELGGSLSAHSDGPGKGAVFTLILPQAPPSQSEPPPKPEPQ